MSPPLQIAYLSIHSSPVGALGTSDTGGMSVYLRELSAAMGAQGHRIDIFTARPMDGYAPVTELSRGVRLVQLADGSDSTHKTRMDHYPHLAEYAGAISAFRDTEASRYDLIHSHYWISGIVGLVLRRLWRRPHIHTYHTLAAAKQLSGAGKHEPQQRLDEEVRLGRSCDLIITATEAEKRNVIRYCGVDSARIGVVPCGVNLQRFRCQQRHRARRRLGIDLERAIVLFVGRFDPVKGLDRLLTALSLIDANRRPHLLVVGGDGDAAEATRHRQRQVSRLGLQQQTTFIGRIDQKDLRSYYAAANILVVPSAYESFGLVALEALACGTPVVATPVGAMAQVIRSGQTGQITTDLSPEAIAAGIQRCLFDLTDDLLPPAAIRQSVLDFGWGAAADAMVALYQRLATTIKPNK